MPDTFAEISGFLPTFALARVIQSYVDDATSSPNIRERTECGAELLILDHFGLTQLSDTDEVVDRALSNAVDYFTSFDPKDESSEGWFVAYSYACLVGAYCGRWEMLSSISERINYDFGLSYVGGLDFETQYLYQVMASYLRGAKVTVPPNFSEAFANVKKVRPKYYIEMWNCLMERDSAGFSKALTKSLKKFTSRKKPALDATFGSEWIARTESIFTNIAIRDGLTIPPLAPAYRSVVLVSGLEMLSYGATHQ